jgi:subtilase family serine protease
LQVTPIALLAGGVLLAGGALAGTPAAVLAVAPAAASTSVPSNFAYACGASFRPGKATCLAIENTAAHPTAQTVRPGAIPSGFGYGPSDLQSAYGLTSASDADGAGTTVAVVDAYDDPTAASDLATYRAAAGLPALTSGQFTEYNEEGQTSPLPGGSPAGDDWSVEESLDVDMVSAICPLCKIDVVEADDDTLGNLFTAEQTAATTLGAKYISDSWAGPEAEIGSVETTLDSAYFGVPGVVYVAAAGDLGYAGGMVYPAASPNVVSVGGTALTPSTNSRGWTESVWNTLGDADGAGATGSGCSAFEPQPSWQTSVPIIASACSNRVDNDVAADADPQTGAAIYDSSLQVPPGTQVTPGWLEAGGNSESAPIIAAVFALAGNDGNGGNNAADSIYTHTSDLYQVTGGSDGTCTESVLCTATGAPGTYNGPTGWGTPDGITAFESNSAAANTVTVTSPGSQAGPVGTAVSLQISATDSAAGQTLTYGATGLPPGLSISSAGLISGTPTTAGASQVTVTATDTTGASGTASFTWTIGAAAANTVTVTNPGSQTGTVGTAASLQISATDSDSSQTLTYTATGLPAGLSISSAGLISGTPTTAGTSQVTVTATDTSGASGTTSFTWTISAATSNSGNTVTVTNPGTRVGIAGTAAASLQISATDSDSSQALSYIALSLPPGLLINSSTGLISGTPAIAGTSDVGIIVSDNTGAAVSTSFTWTISATAAACTARQLLGNAGFDTGSIKPWSSTAGVLAKSKRGVRAQAGSWLARLDGYGAAHKDTLAQTVTIPAACKNAMFTYWVEVHSTVTNKTQQAKNTLDLDVLNASGKVVKTVLVATAANHGTKYVKHTINLASYAGQTITIKFIGTEVSGGSTSFLEDSNALNS